MFRLLGIKALANAPRVGDLPLRAIPAIPSHVTMSAARKLAASKRINLLLVERDEQIVGVIDERSLATTPDEMSIAMAMKPVGPSLRPSMSFGRARTLFILARAAVLPVLAGGFILGAVARGDVEPHEPVLLTRR